MNRTEIARQTLAAQTVAELRDLAREVGIRGRSAMRKAELVAALIPTQLAEMALVEANRSDAEVPPPARVAATPTQDAEQLDLAVRGLRQGGWAAHSARALLSARAAGRRADLDSLTTRLRRDLANGGS